MLRVKRVAANGVALAAAGAMLALVAGRANVEEPYFSGREQLCIVICPYGRIQSALIDDHSMVIGYDTARGEPRGKPVGRPLAGPSSSSSTKS